MYSVHIWQDGLLKGLARETMLSLPLPVIGCEACDGEAIVTWAGCTGIPAEDNRINYSYAYNTDSDPDIRTYVDVQYIRTYVSMAHTHSIIQL